MSACEKCWADSGGGVEYHYLVSTRNCTPEEQAGEAAQFCPACGRKVLHQYTGECMAGCEQETSK
jgi:hypothetical protein